jgi:plasmid stabilization system protein ParE
VTAALIVQPEAEADLSEAFRWYETRRAGLGHEFLDEVSHAFTRISEQPLRYAVVHREARRMLLRRFPYAVFYVARVDRVFVLAVLHQRRSPRRYRSRARNFKAE